MDEALVEQNLDFVNTPEFDNQCLEKARLLALSPDESSDCDYDYDYDDSSSSAALHEVSLAEARLYYAGVGPKGRGPKLIYRTSSDIFEEPSGPEAYRRLMKAIAVPNDHDHEFSKDRQWGRVRDKVCPLLSFYAAIS